jgi:hypothetical protein
VHRARATRSLSRLRCVKDADLRAEVESLIAHHDEAGSFWMPPFPKFWSWSGRTQAETRAWV